MPRPSTFFEKPYTFIEEAESRRKAIASQIAHIEDDNEEFEARLRDNAQLLHELHALSIQYHEAITAYRDAAGR